MAVITKATLEAVLKELYPSGLPSRLFGQEFALLSMLAKKGDLGGSLTKIPMAISAGFGRAKSFSNAKANQAADIYDAWLVKSSQDYAYGTITRKAMKEAQNDKQAFVRSVTELINNRIYSLTESIANDVYRGGGARAELASFTVANPGVLTLANAADSVLFEVSMTLEIRNGATVRLFDTGVQKAKVAKIDRLAGTLTLDVEIGAGATLVAGDQIWIEGDYAVATGSEGFKGLQAWLPASVSPSDSFFGVNRSVDRVRLAGIYQEYSNATIEEALVQTGRLVKRESGKSPSIVLMNDDKAAELVLELGSKVERMERQVGEFSFSTLKVYLNGGSAEILTDRFCPVNEAFMLNLSTWGLHHAPGELIELVDEDGNMLFREGDADGFEIRAAAYAQLVCTEPGANARVKLPG